MLKVPLSWVGFIAIFVLASGAAMFFFQQRVDEVGGRFAPGTCLRNEEVGVIYRVEALREGSYSLMVVKSEKFPDMDQYTLGARSQPPVPALDASSDLRPHPCPDVR